MSKKAAARAPATNRSHAARAHAITRSQGGHHAGGAWDEAKHPRHPAGTSEGGEFAPTQELAKGIGIKNRVVMDVRPAKNALEMASRRNTYEAGEAQPSLSATASQPITVYHGTASDVTAAIQREGIRPRGSPGADAWGLKHFGSTPEAYYGMTTAQIAERNASVFLTGKKEWAEQFSALATEMHPGSTAVVITVKIPKGQIRVDPASHPNMQALTFKGTIPPEWIQSITPAHPTRRAFGAPGP